LYRVYEGVLPHTAHWLLVLVLLIMWLDEPHAWCARVHCSKRAWFFRTFYCYFNMAITTPNDCCMYIRM